MTSIHSFFLSDYMLGYIEEHVKLYPIWLECWREFLVDKFGNFEEDMLLEELKYQESRGISLQETEVKYRMNSVLVPPHAKIDLPDTYSGNYYRNKQSWRLRKYESKTRIIDKLYTSLYQKWNRTWEFENVTTPKGILCNRVLVVKEPKVRKAKESADESRYDIDAFIQSRLNKDRTIKCKVLLEEYGEVNKKLFQNRYYLIKKKL